MICSSLNASILLQLQPSPMGRCFGPAAGLHPLQNVVYFRCSGIVCFLFQAGNGNLVYTCRLFQLQAQFQQVKRTELTD